MKQCPLCQDINIKVLYSGRRVWTCYNCGMIFRNPQPTPQELDQFYNEAFRPENVANNSTGMAGTTSLVARQYVSYLDANVGVASKKVLEFGAGLGITCRALKEFGAEITAIEPFAWSDCLKTGIPTYRSLTELPEDLQFDLIVTLNVVEHLQSPWQTLRQLHDRLRSGGWLYVVTPNAACLRACLQRDRWGEMAKWGHLFFYTPETLQRALKRAGFRTCKRALGYIQYSDRLTERFLHRALQAVGWGGELRYLAPKE